ncbi:MAG: amidohydrolase family protein [Dehalococcoidia bacterium]|nr:amidohydrolase family protein [Dehalococcoidia bacterium]
MKIDVYTHFLPGKYHDALAKHMGKPYAAALSNPNIIDVDFRLRMLDKYDDLVQVLTPTGPPLEAIAKPAKAAELARIANDAMAEILVKHPDRFVAGVALVPTNNIEAALDETDRAIKELHFKGIYLFTPQFIYGEIKPSDDTGTAGHMVGNLPTNTKPIDIPELMPLYEKMAQYDLPIWLHPRTTPAFTDYTSEKISRYRIWQIFGWPYHTTAAMTRLIFSGIMDKYPNIKFMTHHAGAMVPFFERRIAVQYDYDEASGGKDKQQLSNNVLDYYRRFYVDTALHGGTPSLMCSYSFYGAEHMLFATDVPHDSTLGDLSIRDTITAIENMKITKAEKKAIFEGNAKKLLRLNI